MPGKKTSGLGPPGQKLWDDIHGDLSTNWELDAREEHLLHEACLIADQIAALEDVVAREGHMTTGARGQTVVHPAVVEGRQLRIAQQRLLKGLELQDPAEVRARMSPASRRASAAARVRWDKERALGKVG